MPTKEDRTIMYSQLHEMVLRADRPTDESTLRRLAALDSKRPIRGRALLAEVDGQAVAAIGIDDGKVVADPFEHTRDAVELLRLRASAIAA
jgi:hypothetical protein